MKKILLCFALAGTLSLAACDTTKSVLEGGSSLLTPISNPIGMDQSYEIEAAVATARRAGLSVMQLRQCRASESALSGLCVKRAVRVKIRNAELKLEQVLVPYRNFVDNNDQISAVGAALAVRKAISDYVAATQEAGK